MSQILMPQIVTLVEDDTLTENVRWLGQSNKYIERQWMNEVKDFGEVQLIQKDNFDKSFISEYSFIVKHI